ncbi:MAG TPA: LysM peptidoglycan-binding domain-containing protein [Gaiellales bacterium]|nr:LysM peptidoglycan-binding domain-containing protein [Gaiellales bacterium]
MRFGAAAAAGAIVLALLAAPPAEAGRYVVRWGDTLTWIAQDHHVGLKRLARMNHRNPYAVLVAGTVLRVPGPPAAGGRATARYTVQWGDTLTAIAGRYHVGLGRLARANGLRVRGILISGTTLRIPGHGRSHVRRHAPRHHAHAGRGAGAGWRGRYRVRSGDTLTAIGGRFGVGIRKLARANGLRIHDLLLTGARLRVPLHRGHAGATPSPAPAPWSVGWSIDHWSAHYGVDPHLVRAVAWQESGFHVSAVSVAGAWGVMQVTPATWSFVESWVIGAPVAHTPDGGVRVGVAFLRHLLVAFGGNVRLAVAAYYQGETATRMFGVLPISRPYVANVLALRTRL